MASLTQQVETKPAARFEDILEELARHKTASGVDLLQRAYMYSAKVHAGQLRKSGEPYLNHPIAVALILAQLGLDEASVATGLLHDTVEDTLATLDELKELFGAEIAALVDGVTKLSQIRFDTDEHKQAENFRKMLVAMAKDIRVILVKLADRLHNMRTLEHMKPNKQVRIAQETLDIYAPLANRLGIFSVKSELEDLAFKHLHPDEFRSLEEKVREFEARWRDYVGEVVGILKQELAKHGIDGDVSGRRKHLYSIHRKMVSRRIEFEQVYDVIAFRVLVDTVGQCYEVLGHVHSLWHPIPGRFKDYIAMPKPNHYQSLHTSVVGPRGERIEVQIRTRHMHQVAEDGIAAHWEYKEKDGQSGKSKQEFTWLRQLLESQRDVKDPNEFLDTVKYDLFTDEVFVFTPRGEVISLKRGSTPLDFAFAIHTQVGTHCAGAKVNGRMVPLRYELKNGDMVEIITNPQQRPSKDWLSIVATGRAKAKIRAIVRGDERERSLEVGRELLERELRKHDISLAKLTKDGVLDEVAKATHHNTADGLFVAIGYGRTPVSAILEKVAPNLPPAPPPTAPAGKRPVTDPSKRSSSGGVVVQGIDDMMVRFAKCCNPLPGDPIIGFVTRGRGITVHTGTCTRAMDMDPERRIDVKWDDKWTAARPVTIRVITADRPGILAHISQCFTDHGVNISQANCKVTSTDRATNTFEVHIKDVEQLRRVMGQIRGLKGVMGAERV